LPKPASWSLESVDTPYIPNQNLFRRGREHHFDAPWQTRFFIRACITDLIVKEGLINLDFADVRTVMREKGKAMMGMGEASGEKRVLTAAEAAISNPLIEDPSIKRASGLLISITGGKDLTLFEVDQAATRIREEADQDANIIVGATFDESLDGVVRVSVVATGIDNTDAARQTHNDSRRIAGRTERSAPLSQFERPPLRATTHLEGRPATPASEYSHKAAPQSLDAYGRSSPVHNSIEEDVLDIPAFLRRKAV
jgi:cell division protein FtsZ